jgi:predicted transcriptional regulator
MTLYSQVQKVLFDAGLSEVELLVYIELLKEPSKNKWGIVNRTKLPKTTVYRAFEKLEKLKMINKNEFGYKALSLQGLVSQLKSKSLKMNKTICKMQALSPYLSKPNESIEEIETLFTLDQIVDAYLFMSEQNYSTNLDFGDFEGFISTMGGIPMAGTFQKNRAKHAKNIALCTTTGPNTQYFSTKDHEEEFNTNIKVMNMDYKGHFTIFSNEDDYVLFNYFRDIDNQTSVLVKSKAIAEAERAKFNIFSKKLGNSS